MKPRWIIMRPSLLCLSRPDIGVNLLLGLPAMYHVMRPEGGLGNWLTVFAALFPEASCPHQNAGHRLRSRRPPSFAVCLFRGQYA